MRFDIITIFPEFFSGTLDYGIVRRARESGIIDVRVHDLRDFTHDRHRTVDDRPFGGGEGMVLKPEPIFEAVESLTGCSPPASGPSSAPASSTAPANVSGARSKSVVLLSAAGKLFRQPVAQQLAHSESIVLLCGRYEGVDERVAQHLATDELSIGDFVLSGGELAAALVVDAVTRLLPGALGNEASSIHESFSDLPIEGEQGIEESASASTGETAASQRVQPLKDLPRPTLLDWPHYTRPALFRGWQVPEVLLGGNHDEVRRWRHQQSLEKTRRNRPDLLRAT